MGCSPTYVSVPNQMLIYSVFDIMGDMYNTLLYWKNTRRLKVSYQETTNTKYERLYK